MAWQPPALWCKFCGIVLFLTMTTMKSLSYMNSSHEAVVKNGAYSLLCKAESAKH